ncbi:MAG: hypothetical protein IJL41_06395 [Clostridia bacterium]|nr:hypothetical protein [Clostridia bacterium]
MKTNGTVKMLVLSAVSVVLCLVMLLGATFAWFTNKVTSSNNVVKTAGFDVVLQWSETCSADSWQNLTNSSVLFANNEDALMPGDYTKIVYIKISNENDYAVVADITFGKEQLTVTQGDEEITGSPLKLCYKVLESEAAVATAALTVPENTFNTEFTVINGVELSAKGNAGAEKIVAIAFLLPDTFDIAADADSVVSIVTTFDIVVAGSQQHS